METPGKSVQYIAGAILAVATVVAVTILLLPRDQARALIAEHGPIENLSVAVLGVGVICAVLTTWRRRSLIWMSITLMLMWMVMRELDFQKLFTPRSIESLGFYLNPKFPLFMKLAALAALAPFGVAGLHLLVSFVRALRQPGWLFAWRHPLGLGAILALAARVSEKLFSSEEIEETAELAFATLVVVLVMHFAFRRRQSSPETARPAPSSTPT